MQAFTIPVGFPLKLSEIFAVTALGLGLVSGQRTRQRAFGGWALLLLAVTLLFSVMTNISGALPVNWAYGYDHGFTFDLIQYAAYAALVLGFGWALAHWLDVEAIGRAVSIAVRVAAGYCLVQLALWIVGAHGVLELVHGTTQVGQSYGLLLPRNGPFLEGNYLGFFAGTALFLCARRRDKVGVALAVACLFYSQTTSGLIAVLGALLVLAMTRPFSKAAAGIAGALGVFFAAALFVPAVGTLVQVQLAKLGIGDIQGNVPYTQSLQMRSASTISGYRIAGEHPWFGVGPGRYGVWNNVALSGHPGYLNPIYGPHRPIANNAYSQVFAELGIAAGVVLVLLMLALVWRLRRGHPADFGLAVFALIGLNTAPSWTQVVVWIAIGYLIAVAGRNPDAEVAPAPGGRHRAAAQQ